MHNDRDFAHIERRKAGAHVCIPADWDVVVQEACPRKPFDVVAMEPSNLLILQSKQSSTHKGIQILKKKPVLISKAVWVNFGQGRDITGEVRKHPDKVWLRYSYSEDEPWSKVSLRKDSCLLHMSFLCLRNI